MISLVLHGDRVHWYSGYDTYVRISSDRDRPLARTEMSSNDRIILFAFPRATKALINATIKRR